MCPLKNQEDFNEVCEAWLRIGHYHTKEKITSPVLKFNIPKEKKAAQGIHPLKVGFFYNILRSKRYLVSLLLEGILSFKRKNTTKEFFSYEKYRLTACSFERIRVRDVSQKKRRLIQIFLLLLLFEKSSS